MESIYIFKPNLSAHQHKYHFYHFGHQAKVEPIHSNYPNEEFTNIFHVDGHFL